MRLLRSRSSLVGAAIISGSLILPAATTAAQVTGETTSMEEVTSEESQFDRATDPEGSSQRARNSWKQNSWWNQPPSNRNPRIPEKCGAKITLVLDASGSIGDKNNDVRRAANAFLEALKDTGSSGRVVDFATAARQTAPMTLITSGSLASGGAHRQALNSYYQFGKNGGAGPAPNTRRTQRGNPTADRSYQNRQDRPQFTNWQEALNKSEGSGTELIVFITDGDPTAATSNGRSNGSGRLQMPEPFAGSDTRLVGSGGDFKQYAFYKGVNAANALKSSGPRMLTVGVGSALNNSNSVSRLQAISGPTVYRSGDFNINSYDVALVQNFDALGRSLKKVATELCSPSLTITKRAQTPDSASFDPTPGWEYTVNPTVPQSTYVWTQPGKGDPPGAKSKTTNKFGQAQFQWEPNGPRRSVASVSEKNKPGWSFERAECRRLDDGTPSSDPPFSNGSTTYYQKDFTVPIGTDSIVTCEYYNSFDYQPAIELTKTVEDDPVRGNAQGWNQIYRFTVKNTGNSPLSQIVLSDAQCRTGTLTGPTGDANNDQVLQRSETWSYSCERLIRYATTTQKISDTNNAIVQGVSPNRKIVKDRAQKTIDVKTPELDLIKTAKRPDGTAINDGDTVPAGTLVTYGYRVTNIGNDTVGDIQISDDKCSPLTRTTGSGTAIAPGDSWDYVCQARLLPPSTESSVTNTATVSGLWSNPNNKAQNNGRVTDTARKTIRVSKTAVINVIKKVNPLPAADQDFNFTITGSGAGVASADAAFTLNPGASAPVFSRQISVTPTPGNNDYVIAEGQLPNGWTFTALDCVSGTGDGVTITVDNTNPVATLSGMAIGDVVTCVFENQQQPKLTIRKQAVGVDGNPDNTTTFKFSSPPISSDFDLKNGASKVLSLSAGQAPTVTEESSNPGGTLSDDWSTSVTCTGLGASRGSVGTIVPQVEFAPLQPGDDITCLFVNAKKLVPPPPQLATLTITKQLDPVGPGPAFDFNLSGGQSESFALQPDATGSASRTFTLQPDTYTVSEQVSAGWALAGITCDGASNSSLGTDSVTLEIGPGDAVTCQFTNKRNPSLTVAKSASFDAAGSVPFPFGVTGPTPQTFSLANGDQEREQVDAANYQITERLSSGEAPKDWRLAGNPVCTGTVVPPAAIPLPNPGVDITIGENEDARCVFTNYYDYRPAIQLVKTVDKPEILQGGSATYTYVVTNTGEEDLETTDVAGMISDDKCAPVTRTSGSGNRLATSGNPAIPGESWTFTCQATNITEDTVNTATTTMTGVETGKTVTSTDNAFVAVKKPGLELTKEARRSLVYDGKDVKFVYRLQNYGQTDFRYPDRSRDQWLDDDKCSSIAYESGDSGNDSVLSIGEVWKLACTTSINGETTNVATTTPTPFLPKTPNLTGTPVPVKKTAIVKVVNKAGIKVVKSASNDKVRSGSAVTYTYKVTNTGSLPLAKVARLISDDRCSDVQFVSGDRNGNNLLENKNSGAKTNETWVFECTATLNRSTTNTVTVTGQPKVNGKSVGTPVTDSDKLTVTIVGPGGGTPANTGSYILLGFLTSIVLIASGLTLFLLVRERA